METTIRLLKDFIKLDTLVKLSGVTGSGGEAKHLIQAGRARVNGEVTNQRGRKLHAGDVVQIDAEGGRPNAAPEAIIHVAAADPGAAPESDDDE